MQNVDYHVGLIRGFLLAHNANQSLLHALDCVLTYRRNSNADEEICSPKNQEVEELRRIANKAIKNDKKNTQSIKETIVIERLDNRTFHRWTPEQEEKIRFLHDDGNTTKEIMKEFSNKSYSQLYAKQVGMGLTPHGKREKHYEESQTQA